MDTTMCGRLDEILTDATKGVWPSPRMLAFYNWVGSWPFHLGTILMLLASPDSAQVIYLAGVKGRTDAALQVLYRYHFRWWRLWWGLGDALFLNAANARSVRSRGRFVRMTASYLLRELATANGHNILRLVSLGSGSASQLLQGAADNGFGEAQVRVVLVDRDPRALKAGVANAIRMGVANAVTICKKTIGEYLRESATAWAHVIEMVGLADYFDNERLQEYLDGIYRAMIAGGYFLGANISSKAEFAYAHGAACWPKMFYRTREELVAMLVKAGFKEDNIWTRMCGLYVVWVAQKEKEASDS